MNKIELDKTVTEITLSSKVTLTEIAYSTKDPFVIAEIIYLQLQNSPNPNQQLANIISCLLTKREATNQKYSKKKQAEDLINLLQKESYFNE